MISNKILKKISLTNEVETAINLLKKGMAELQQISGANDFYHVPILYLSSGFERLIKCLICLSLMDDNGELSDVPFEKSSRKGHDLIYLLDKLLSICAKKNYASKFTAAKADIEFLRKDKTLREIVTILSDFGQGARYHNLDIILNGTSKYKDPKLAWDTIEMTIVQMKGRDLNELAKISTNEIYEEINRDIIIILEKFTRALARLFTLADFGDLAKQVSPLVYNYLFLMDKDLGTKKY